MALFLIPATQIFAQGDSVGENSCASMERYRDVAEVFLSWAVSGEVHETLGAFPTAEKIRNAKRIVVNCPFVAPIHYTPLDSRFRSAGGCATWFLNDNSGECVYLALQILEEKPDYLKVYFGTTWGELAAQGNHFVCRWNQEGLTVEIVEGVLVLS